jgi:hypothetical protein
MTPVISLLRLFYAALLAKMHHAIGNILWRPLWIAKIAGLLADGGAQRTEAQSGKMYGSCRCAVMQYDALAYLQDYCVTLIHYGVDTIPAFAAIPAT